MKDSESLGQYHGVCSVSFVHQAETVTQDGNIGLPKKSRCQKIGASVGVRSLQNGLSCWRLALLVLVAQELVNGKKILST
jgi:hypothetical protein